MILEIKRFTWLLLVTSPLTKAKSPITLLSITTNFNVSVSEAVGPSQKTTNRRTILTVMCATLQMFKYFEYGLVC